MKIPRSNILSAGLSQLDTAIQTILTRRTWSPLYQANGDYFLQVSFEAYEITGIWLNNVTVVMPGEDESVCVYYVGCCRAPCFLEPATARLIEDLLENVHYKPAPKQDSWTAATYDLIH